MPKTLRQQFNYYKSRLMKQLREEQAYREAIGAATFESTIKVFFEHFDYEEIYKHGITRKIGTQTVRLRGEAAIRKQMESFAARASKKIQKENFVNNYISALRESAGNSMYFTLIDEELLERIEKAMKKLPYYVLTDLMRRNILPSIEYIYNQEDLEEIMDRILDALELGTTKDYRNKVLEAREKAKIIYKANLQKERELIKYARREHKEDKFYNMRASKRREYWQKRRTSEEEQAEDKEMWELEKQRRKTEWRKKSIRQTYKNRK